VGGLFSRRMEESVGSVLSFFSTPTSYDYVRRPSCLFSGFLGIGTRFKYRRTVGYSRLGMLFRIFSWASENLDTILVQAIRSRRRRRVKFPASPSSFRVSCCVLLHFSLFFGSALARRAVTCRSPPTALLSTLPCLSSSHLLIVSCPPAPSAP
jgi:hypothetical protein